MIIMPKSIIILKNWNMKLKDDTERAISMLNKQEILEKVKTWIEEVGEIQLEKSGKKNINIYTKSDKIDLVTEVDKLSEKILIEKIRKYYPQHSILSEESGIRDNNLDYQWIIDPLDGTTNYAHGFPVYSISVALKYKEEVILGVVYVPKLNELYFAIKDEGAFLNGERINVSNTKKLEKSLLATGFPYDRATDSNNNLKYFNQIVTKVRGIRRTGSAAFDLCNVAAGRFDGYWELKLNPWDTAAGILLVQEAGGKVINYSGQKLLIAGNKNICDLLLKEINNSSKIY